MRENCERRPFLFLQAAGRVIIADEEVKTHRTVGAVLKFLMRFSGFLVNFSLDNSISESQRVSPILYLHVSSTGGLVVMP